MSSDNVIDDEYGSLGLALADRKLSVAEVDIKWLARLIVHLKEASNELSTAQGRHLVDLYYQFQELRKATDNEVRSLKDNNEPSHVLDFFAAEISGVEQTLQKVLDTWTDTTVPGRWAKSQYGIGPVLTAGLLANLDIRKAPTAANFMRFCGLDPTVEWLGREKSKELVNSVIGDEEISTDHIATIALQTHRRFEVLLSHSLDEREKLSKNKLTKFLSMPPYSQKMKVLMWKIGDCFVKFHNNPKCYYGHLYAQRKALEVQRNENGEYAEIAKETLLKKNIKDVDTRKRYLEGKLPDGRIDLRARNFAERIFINHVHWVMYENYYGVAPPKPYAIEHLGHAEILEPPNWPMA